MNTSSSHKQTINTYRLASIGLMAALVFVSSMISISIPVGIGDNTRIHLGNAFCLLSGLILGPVGGGLSAGIGSFLYDLMNPMYIASSPFTFVFKFTMGFLCGLIAHAGNKHGERASRNIVAAIVGAFVYVILYLTKNFVESALLGNTIQANLAATGTRAVTSSINAIFGVIISIPLGIALRTALKRAHIWNKVSGNKQ